MQLIQQQANPNLHFLSKRVRNLDFDSSDSEFEAEEDGDAVDVDECFRRLGDKNAKEKEKDGLRKRLEGVWSGQDVIRDYDPERALWIVGRLNRIKFWRQGMCGVFALFRHCVKSLVKSTPFEQCMTLCVTVNTVFLAMDRYPINQDEEDLLKDINFAFTIIFCAEFAFKLFGLGVKSKC